MPTATLTSQPDRGVGGGNQALNPLALASHLLWGSADRRRTLPFLEDLRVPPFRPQPLPGKCISYSVCNVGPSPGAGRGGGGGGVAFCAAGWGWGHCIETSLPKQTGGAESRASPARARPGRAQAAPETLRHCPVPGDARGPTASFCRHRLPTHRRGHHRGSPAGVLVEERGRGQRRRAGRWLTWSWRAGGRCPRSSRDE